MRCSALFFVLAAFGLAACDSPAAPEAEAPRSTVLSAAPIADTPANGVEVHRAEFRGGFCFFVVMDGGFQGYSGPSTTVITSSGNTQYRCKGDLLFGNGITEVLNLIDVPFTGEFLGPPMPSCHVRATPGANGQAMVTCHMKD